MTNCLSCSTPTSNDVSNFNYKTQQVSEIALEGLDEFWPISYIYTYTYIHTYIQSKLYLLTYCNGRDGDRSLNLIYICMKGLRKTIEYLKIISV
jgi:hypothetical protein